MISFFSLARSCGAPTDISHGWHAGECYTFGCRITYHCAEGYELVGKNERFCQADGTWTPKDLPTCVCECNSIYLCCVNKVNSLLIFCYKQIIQKSVSWDLMYFYLLVCIFLHSGIIMYRCSTKLFYFSLNFAAAMT